MPKPTANASAVEPRKLSSTGYPQFSYYAQITDTPIMPDSPIDAQPYSVTAPAPLEDLWIETRRWKRPTDTPDQTPIDAQPNSVADQPIDILSLLKRWRELEPERCNTFAENIDEAEVFWIQILFYEYDDKELFDTTHDCNDSKQLSLLQRALQQAIVARGLNFYLYVVSRGLDLSFCVDEGGGKFAAGVYADTDELPKGIKDDEPAIALLRAYVAWLEEQHES